MDEYTFTSQYKVGDIVFFADIINSLVRKLRLRTVQDRYMVGVVDKMDTVFIGKDKKNCLHSSMLDAKRYLESLGKTAEIEIIVRESGGNNE